MENAESVTVPTVKPDLVAQTKPAAWGGCRMASPCSLSDVMSETLAQQMELKELQDAQRRTNSDAGVDSSSGWLTCDNVDTSSDLLLAQMLQFEMDAEHDLQLKREEDKFNGSSKVKVTYDMHRSLHPSLKSETEFDYSTVVENREKKDVGPQFKRSGISGKGKNIVTKHDPEICSRKNARKVMENFPPEFETGDGADMRLPNHVFNQLKVHSKVDNKRGHRVHEKKEHATAEQAVDPKTRLIMYKLVNSGILEAVNGVISCGKESVVFHAVGGSRKNEVVPAECVLKVFKTTLAEFRNRWQYVRGDVRFFKDEFKKQNPRKIMKIWAEKEMINLQKMKKCGVPCPSVVLLKKHILVMSFIGEGQIPAPKLKDAKLSDAEYELAYDQCVQYMKTMYKDCLLVHADLSEYNLLWWKDQLYVIDVAQSVDAMHPRAMQFLLRDCRTVCEFFKKRGVVSAKDEYHLFNQVTGLELRGQGEEFLSQIEKYEKDERLMKLGLSKTDYPFDYFFAKAASERTAVEECTVDCDANDDDDDDGDDDDDASSSDSDSELTAVSEAVDGSNTRPILPLSVDVPISD